MKIIKTRLRNKMKDKFFANSMIIYIERKFAQNFSSNSNVNDFKLLKEHYKVFFTPFL